MATTAQHERDRLAALHALEILDTPPEERFDRIARLAALLLDTPIALVTFVDAERQWFKSSVGLPMRETPRALSFCAHAVAADAPLVVGDASADPRFTDNELVTGDPFIRFYAGFPVHAPGGAPLGTVCVIDREPREVTAQQLGGLRDLAQLAELELTAARVSDALVARQAVARLQDEFIRVAAHDLRTPLTSVRGYAEQLGNGDLGELDDGQRSALSAIRRNAVRLEELTEDLLLVLRLEAGTVEPERENLDLSEVVRASIEAHSSFAEGRGVDVTIAPGRGVDIEADARLLSRAIAATVRNAIAGSPAGGEVRVLVEAGDPASVVIEDSGSAMTPDERAQIAEPFYRAPATAAGGGGGLGLTIARGVAHAHGGRLQIDPTADAGTRLTLVLPLSRPPEG